MFTLPRNTLGARHTVPPICHAALVSQALPLGGARCNSQVKPYSWLSTFSETHPTGTLGHHVTEYRALSLLPEEDRPAATPAGPAVLLRQPSREAELQIRPGYTGSGGALRPGRNPQWNLARGHPAQTGGSGGTKSKFQRDHFRRSRNRIAAGCSFPDSGWRDSLEGAIVKRQQPAGRISSFGSGAGQPGSE